MPPCFNPNIRKMQKSTQSQLNIWGSSQTQSAQAQVRTQLQAQAQAFHWSTQSCFLSNRWKIWNLCSAGGRNQEGESKMAESKIAQSKMAKSWMAKPKMAESKIAEYKTRRPNPRWQNLKIKKYLVPKFFQWQNFFMANTSGVQNGLSVLACGWTPAQSKLTDGSMAEENFTPKSMCLNWNWTNPDANSS